MKKILFIILLSAGTIAKAQQQENTTNPIKGCWVVENNVSSPKNQTIKFYNANQQLVYQETYNKKFLRVSKKRIRNILDSALVTVLTKNKSNEATTLANVIRNKP